MKYPKIQTVYLRDPDNNYKTLLEGQWASPEFCYLAKNEWIFTEKIDGTNIRVHWNSFGVEFNGRTDKAQIPPFLEAKLGDMFSPDAFEALYPDTPMILYGEGYGARIQKGGGNYIPDGVSFILFDILVDGVWLKHEDVEDIGYNLGINVVPRIGYGTLLKAINVVSAGFKSHIGSQIAEGLVMKPAVDLLSRRGRRIIAKIKYKDFPR